MSKLENLESKDSKKIDYSEIEIMIKDLFEKPMSDLVEFGRALSIENYQHLNKHDLIIKIIEKKMENLGLSFGGGVLEIMENGFGFLRQSDANYVKSYKDLYVPPGHIKSYRLKKGDTVFGFLKEPSEGEKAEKGDKFKAISEIVLINYTLASNIKERKSFDSLTPIYPDFMYNLEDSDNSDMVSTRILNLFAPIGKGQRSLIVAPPRTGKTILLQNIANALVKNHPDVYLIVLLIDERPEEVTDMQRSVRGEVISSTFDEEPDKHCQVAEMVLEKAKRLVESKIDVVILLDSITRLARAYNQIVPASGKVLSGGVDAKALIGPKKFFGAARNIENGGSLTIIGTALIDTGSRMDEVIFEEFKGTGNMEVYLDRSLAERRIFPAFDIFKSGTRKEELLINKNDLEIIWTIREKLSSNKQDNGAIMKALIDKIKSFKTNKAFLGSIHFNGKTSVF
ncbi:MAG TPA: transcription termination factor Rho [Spirochaetota bacterium]|nr:transcription termination factor Rho [Spirochaetota bacterium]HOM38969.1 transcription termination factor Rho [Spirochaetota bacterium]HPQ48371.1 transcription termination factor Rho [Spirochaetota bacterium]